MSHAAIQPSFHNRLLSRSTLNPPTDSRRRILLRFLDRWSWMVQVLILATTFGGGLAMGAGLILLNRDEDGRGNPALMIGVGIGCLFVAMFGHLATSGAARRRIAPIRG